MEFIHYLKAGYPCLWIQTYEEKRAIENLSKEAIEATIVTEEGEVNTGYTTYAWDYVNGIVDAQTKEIEKLNPVLVLQKIVTLPKKAVVFLCDYHRFLGGVEVIRTLKNILPDCKATYKHIIIISPISGPFPPELEKEITLFPFGLPTIEELKELAQTIIKENDLTIEVTDEIINAAKGLTMQEAENAIARSLVAEKILSKAVLEEEKLQTIKKSGLMEIYNPVPLDQLGGLEELIDYIGRRKESFTNMNLPAIKPILLIGPPGTGKTLTAKVMASVLQIPLIRLDLGALKGGLVGQSEENLRKAEKLIDGLGNSVVLMDEMEKSLAGSSGRNSGDSGTSANMVGELLNWMEESKVRKLIIATCNDIENFLTISQGAFLRRFGAIFLIDFPTEIERIQILDIMNKRYKTEIPKTYVKEMEDWTGAEIEKFVIDSIYDGTKEAFKNIKPIAIQNKEIINQANQWAVQNARFANRKENDVVKELKSRKLNI